jgi:hypothetical protein
MGFLLGGWRSAATSGRILTTAGAFAPARAAVLTWAAAHSLIDHRGHRGTRRRNGERLDLKSQISNLKLQLFHSEIWNLKFEISNLEFQISLSELWNFNPRLFPRLLTRARARYIVPPRSAVKSLIRLIEGTK